MSKKVLTGALAAMMAAGIAPTIAGASTDVEAIYAAAHKATVKALESGSQADINAAREAIRQLPENMEAAIGEFSKQVDTVQHPIFKNIVDAIAKLDGEGLNQTNINAARLAIPAELNSVFAQSYSSAIDAKQLLLQSKTTEAVNVAIEQRTQESVDIARALINDVYTSTSSKIRDWAATMSGKLDAVVVKEIKAIDVISLTTDTVKVTFDALPKAILGATVKVLNSEGNVIEVTPKDLEKGATEAEFSFEGVVSTSDFTGIWTIGGIEFDTSISKFIQEFAILEEVQIMEMEDLLRKHAEEFGLTEVKYTNDNYKAYLKHSDRVNATTLDDVKKIIKESNMNLESSNEVKNFINEAKDLQPSEFKAALEHLKIERANEAYYNEYKVRIEALANDQAIEKVYTDVQNAIDAENIARIRADYDESSAVKDEVPQKEELISLLNNIKEYYPEKVVEEDDIQKQEMINKVNEKLAIAEVNVATNSGALIKALEKVAQLPGSTLDIAIINKGIQGELLAYKNDGHNQNKTIEEITTLVENGTTIIITEKIKLVGNQLESLDEDSNATEETAVMNAFKVVEIASSKVAEVDGRFDSSRVIKENLMKYAEEFNVDTDTVVELTSLVETVNKDVKDDVLEAIVGVKADGSNLTQILKNGKFSNVIEANNAHYVLEKDLFTEFAAEGLPVGGGAVLTEEQPNVEAAIIKVQKLIDAINGKVTALTSKTQAEVVNGLNAIVNNYPSTTLSINLKAYLDSSVHVRRDIADLIILQAGKFDPLKITLGLTEPTEPELKALGEVLGDAFDTHDDVLLELNKLSSDTEFSYNTIIEKLEILSGEEVSIEVATKFVELRDANTNSDNSVVKFKNFTEVRTILNEAIANPASVVVE